jgi:tRNA uridine 5-carboxymethylaminomethyl modification enzyme
MACLRRLLSSLKMREFYDVIVIGGGHAGAEAAWAAASLLASASIRHDTASARRGNGAFAHPSQNSTPPRVALITMDPSKIGAMSCNPAIGGLAKGQMVREIDALGGLMGLAADATGIMFKMLNTSKGAAVRGPRAQCDKYAYAAEVQRLISTRSNIDVIAGTVDDIVVEDGRVIGVVLPAGSGIVIADQAQIDRNLLNDAKAQPIYSATPVTGPTTARLTSASLIPTSAVVLTTGTFMRALMHTGERKTQGGRINEGAAVGISATLRKLGFELGRLKTGTPPRLARESLDWDSLATQTGDEPPTPFSDMTNANRAENGPAHLRGFPRLPQTHCRITRTTPQAHDLIRANIHRAPMYSGQINAECGPRYCPSIEDKVVKFAQRDSHHVFLEPESLHTNEIYCNGISTSLPEDVQEKIVHSMPGCERAVILRWGYAVEYDMVWPHQIDSTGMTKKIRGLFFAGQINGTSGYEEAGGQGLIAGLNAALLSTSPAHGTTLASSLPDRLIRLRRDQAYIGVMMDDLVTKTPREPYRMFTSRAEHRLRLRADNADERLTPLGRELGLVDDHRWAIYQRRQRELQTIRDRFDRIFVDGKSLREFARRPETTAHDIASRLDRPFDIALIDRVMTEARYDGYIIRQHAEIKRQALADSQRIPQWLNIDSIDGLRRETAETLKRFRPATMGQASRLAGVTPADLTLLSVVIQKFKAQRKSVDSLEVET